VAEKACGSYDVVREGEEVIARIDCETCPFFPSLEDVPRAMALVMDALAEIGTATKVVLVQKRDYEYDYNQTQMLLELARIYRDAVKRKLAYGLLADPAMRRWTDARYARLQELIHQQLKQDPVGAYVELHRLLRDERQAVETGAIPAEGATALKGYLAILDEVVTSLDRTKLITALRPYLPGYRLGDRGIYRRVLSPAIKPDFMYTRLMASYPPEGEELGVYTVGDTEVTVFGLPDTVQFLYHMVPPEFKLTEEKYELLDAARKILAEHKPSRQEFVDPERMRQVFTSIGGDLLEELASYRGLRLRNSELESLTDILVRYTVGFGLVELLLADDKVQDITINSPMGRTPVFIVHGEFGDCMTNIIPTVPEAESWASKLRLISGRPLDEANPILDTELVLPAARARVAAITAPLNPTGIAFALRRHRDKPWTLPLFIKSRMITPLAAGVMSFLIDGARTMLVAGTRSAGKTSLLGSVMVEIIRKSRILTIEDSVTGDARIVIERNGRLERTTVGRLIDGLIARQGCEDIGGRELVRPRERLRAYAIGKDGKVRLAPVSQCMRHRVGKPIYEVRTATGRTIKVTGDHALFTLGTEELLRAVKANELQPGDCIVTPRLLPNEQKPMPAIDLTIRAHQLPGTYLQGPAIHGLIERQWPCIKDIAKGRGYAKSAISAWKRQHLLPSEVFAEIGESIPHEGVRFKKRTSSTRIPARLELTPALLKLAGLWLANGSYDTNSIIISVEDEGERAVVREAARQLGIEPRMHSDGVSLMLNSGILKDVFQNVLELRGDAYTKRVPGWVFGLSREQAAHVLSGLLSGDGCVGGKEVLIALASEGLLHDLQTLLLQFGIIMRVSPEARRDRAFNGRISSTAMLRTLDERIGFIQEYKRERLGALCGRRSTHDTTDIIPFPAVAKADAVHSLGLNRFDYIGRGFSIGRERLARAIEDAPEAQEFYRVLAQSDILWDRVVSVERVQAEDTYVYDFSVPGYENFVCENILAHNTLELPVDALRKMGFNIQSMKVASALTRGTTEVGADEGIRTTLRLGDSALIVGEVRSVEARALYEAMRVGALANVVAGTIHGDSPYGVFDRVVNDLGVPRTSFKATDIVAVANPVRSPDGIHRWRRMTQLTEVRKHWEEDPIREGGFVDLFKYDAKTDALVPTNDLLAGDSEILKAIAGNVREWAGNWDAVWDNINLRARVKQAMVEAAQKAQKPDLLEAQFYIVANDQFHKVSERVREEAGSLDSERIFFEWNEWLKRAVKKQA
jgi:type IV secretory pathway ATPase VirB11/archaellum biosynthesis ATPase